MIEFFVILPLMLKLMKIPFSNAAEQTVNSWSNAIWSRILNQLNHNG